MSRGLVGHHGMAVLVIESSASHMIVDVEWHVQCLLPNLLDVLPRLWGDRDR